MVRWALSFSSCTQYDSQSLSVPSDQNVELSAPSPAPCLPACCHAPQHDGLKLTLWNCKPQIKSFLLKVALLMLSYHRKRKLGMW